ncbi:antibiotic biosynthesis monooxygenase [Nocardioides sp. zg-1228]|uniref:antibiotic biosynthesis monooxygenase family protein n=1 Tax=Nocardioides sp. zg-1228 TaxID=2763008 RepID=UPI003217E798
MRTWRGAVRPEDADRYLDHQSGTGVREYRATPGNLGVLVLRRPAGDLVEVTTVSLWESMEAIRAFAGDDPAVARFYPGDDELLAEKDLHADHFEVVSTDLDPGVLAQTRSTSAKAAPPASEA